MEISIYESGRSGGAAPCKEKLREKYESRKDVVNQVNILYQLQVAGKMVLKFDPCANNSGFIGFSHCETIFHVF